MVLDAILLLGVISQDKDGWWGSFFSNIFYAADGLFFGMDHCWAWMLPLLVLNRWSSLQSNFNVGVMKLGFWWGCWFSLYIDHSIWLNSMYVWSQCEAPFTDVVVGNFFRCGRMSYFCNWLAYMWLCLFFDGGSELYEGELQMG